MRIGEYKIYLLKQVKRNGWIRCLVWGTVKTILASVIYFFTIDYLWMRISMGLIWVGIASAAAIVVFVTVRTMKIWGPSRPLKIYLGLEIFAGALLIAQLPLLGFGLFFYDGLLTIVSTVIFTLTGYGVSLEIRDLKQPPSLSTNN